MSFSPLMKLCQISRVIRANSRVTYNFQLFPELISKYSKMASTEISYRMVRPDGSTAKSPNPSEEEIDEAWLLNY